MLTKIACTEWSDCAHSSTWAAAVKLSCTNVPLHVHTTLQWPVLAPSIRSQCMVAGCMLLRYGVCAGVMQKLYHVAGVEGKPVVFLLTDTQISKESFLEDVNNLLNSGEVAGMYAPEDKERIIGSIREWLLTQGAPTTKVPTPLAPAPRPKPHLCILLHGSSSCTTRPPTWLLHDSSLSKVTLPVTLHEFSLA